MLFGLEAGTLLVFAVVLVTVALFVTEALPPDVVAIAVVVTLVVFQPLTGVGPEEALSGFSSAATVTILAMYVLSRAVQETGLVRRLGEEVSLVVRGSEPRLVAAVVALTGPIAGVVNNTPVVAVFIPMVSELAEEAGVSPSKVLIPLSYASMLGGTLTLVGTATNLVASDAYVAAARRAGVPAEPFSMFEFTALGALVLVVGSAYLLTVGRALTPARIEAGDRTSGYDVGAYLARVLVPSRSPLVGEPVAEVVVDAHRDLELDVLDVVRGGEHFVAADSGREVDARDVLTVRGNVDTIRRFCDLADLRFLPRAAVGDVELENPERSALVELVLPAESPLVGDTIRGSRLRERYDATVLAVRRGGEVFRESLGDLELRGGDSLLVRTTRESARYLRDVDDFLVTSEAREEAVAPVELSPTTLPAVAILGGVVVVAALGVVPIAIAALGGVVAVVATGSLSATEAYDAVNWNVIFLLAGILPLGIALQETGGVALLAGIVADAATVLPPLVVLAAFYLLTGLLANVITPVASVVLLMPVAVDTAVRLGTDPFAFALSVTFAASTAFMTPVGYQTNLMVYGPGGYRFTDYLRVGGPLQLLLAVVTTLGIALIWGL